MSLSKFESMLKTNDVIFFDLAEFEEIIIHYLDIGKHSLAKKAVKLGLEQHPGTVDLKLLQVELFIFEDALEDAADLIQEIIAINPNNDEVYIQKATLLSKINLHDKAIESLLIALGFAEDKLDIWALIGMEYLFLNDYKNARQYFEKCVEEDVEDYAALYNIVYCFDMGKLHTEAAEYLKSYIDRNPYSEVAWHQLGRQYFVLEMYKEALVSFDYAVLIDENFIGGYLEKAKTLEALKKYKDAIDNYLITVELDDPTAFAYIRIGECFEKLKNTETAIKYYKKAVHEDPLLDKGWVLLTNAYYNQKDYQKASYYILKALRIDENNVLYWRKYSEINIKLNLYEEAVTGFQKCLSLNDVAIEIYIALADVLSFLGDNNDAVKILLNAHEKYSDFAEIEYRLAGLYFILNEEKNGMYYLIKGMEIDYDHHSIIKELYPAVFNNFKVQKLLKDYKKALE